VQSYINKRGTLELAPFYTQPLTVARTSFVSFLIIMSDAAVSGTATLAAPAQTGTPKKQSGGAGKKPRVKPAHPRTSEMVNAAVKNLKERGGSSLKGIKKYISANYKVDVEKLAPFIKKYLKSAVTTGALVQTKGKGASGSFKLSAAEKGEAKKKTTSAPAAKAKKPASAGAKAKTAKSTKTAKPAAKKLSAAKKSTTAAAKKTSAAKSASPVAASKKAAPAKPAKSPAKPKPKAKKPAKGSPTKKPKTPKPKKATKPKAAAAKKSAPAKKK
jgi:hypothetical protein